MDLGVVMNWRMLGISLISAAVGGGAVAGALLSSACRPPVYVEYDEETMRMRPVVRPGDTLIFKTPVNWLIPSRNPCASQVNDPSGGVVECTIASNLSKREFPYDCKNVNCDPEVAVDENPGTAVIIPVAPGGPSGGVSGSPATTALTALTASATEVIYLSCAPAALDVTPPNLMDAEGTVQWKSPDEEVAEWVIELDDAKLCAENKLTFKAKEVCTIQKVSPVGYTAKGKCGGTGLEGKGTVTPKP
jgi:hypothetical protein